MRTVRLLLLASLLCLSACKPKLTMPETSARDTAAEIAPVKKLLLGKWELRESRGNRLVWLNQPADKVKGRTLTFLEDAKLHYQRSGEKLRTSTYRFLDKDTIEIDLISLLSGDAPAQPVFPLKVKVKVDAAELTLTDDKGHFDKYARLP